MRQLFRYICVTALILTVWTVRANAGETVVNATHATVTATDSAGICMLLVEPAEGYYISRDDISVVKTMDGGVGQAPRRADGPGVGEPIALSGDDPDDLSLPRSYTFNMPSAAYGLKVTAEGRPRTVLTREMVAVTLEDRYEYDGTPKEPAVTVAGLTADSDYRLEYQNQTDAGTASIVVTGLSTYQGMVTITFTIEKTASTLKKAPMAKTLSYTGSAQKLVKVGMCVGGEMQYSLDGEQFAPENPMATDAGTYTVYYRVAGDKNHYDIAAETLEVTIDKVPSVVTAVPEALVLTWSGQPQTLIVAGTAAGGTMEYSLDNESFSPDIPTATNAQAYTVYYRVTGDMNHTDVAAATVNARIGRDGEPVFTAPTPRVLTYTGSLQQLVNAGTADGGEVQYSMDGISYAPAIPEGSIPQNYTVYYRVVGDQNHEDIPPASVVVTIDLAPLTIAADSVTIYVGSPIPELTVSYKGFVEGDSEAVLTEQPTLTTTATADSGIGFYAIQVTGGAAENYQVIHVDGLLTISPTLTDENGDAVSGYIQENDEGEVSVQITDLPEDTFSEDSDIPLNEDGFLDIPTIVTGSDGEEYTVTEVASEAFDNMPSSAVVVLPEGVSTSDDVTNVVNGDGTCAEMNLTDVGNLTLPIPVTAEVIIYERTISQYTSVCFPFETPIPEGMKAFELVSGGEGQAHFVESEDNPLQAYKPYILVAEEDLLAPSFGRRAEGALETVLNLSVTDVVIDTSHPIETVEKGSFKLFGTITGLTHAEGIEKQAYIMQDDFSWQMTAFSAPWMANEQYLPPFYSYMCAEGETPLENINTVIDSGVTSIKVPSTLRSQASDGWYDLSGRRLTDKPAKKGVYIRNGRKIAIK